MVEPQLKQIHGPGGTLHWSGCDSYTPRHRSRRITYDPDVEGPDVAMEVLPNLRSFWTTFPVGYSCFLSGC